MRTPGAHHPHPRAPETAQVATGVPAVEAYRAAAHNARRLLGPVRKAEQSVRVWQGQVNARSDVGASSVMLERRRADLLVARAHLDAAERHLADLWATALDTAPELAERARITVFGA